MQNPQDIFDQIQEAKKKQREIRKEYKDTLTNTAEYDKVMEKYNELKEKKKQLETVAQQQMGARYVELEESQSEVKELQEMMNDLAISTLMEGKSLDIKDSYDNEYEPTYKVTFKKVK